MVKQYYDEKDFQALLDFDATKFYELLELLKSDAYNESKIQESIEKAGKEECITIAIQLAVVGYGNKNFGSYKFNGEERDMIQFFERNNIKWNLKMGEKLSEDQLTPSRLIRFCRYYIESYIKKTGNCSYLYKKYCPIQNDFLSENIYRGCEHSIDIKNEELVKGLISTYIYLDDMIDSNILDRIKRVLLARGLPLKQYEEYKRDI